jgi:hypothetical protein
MELQILYTFPPHAQIVIKNDGVSYTSAESFRHKHSTIRKQSTHFLY